MARAQGKKVVVTGAASGIGRAVADLLAREGADLVLNDRRQSDELEQVVQTCRAYGVSAAAAPGDVSDERGSRSVIDEAIRQLGYVDVLVNNAGMLTQAPVEEMSVALWDEMMGMNLRAPFLCTRWVLPHMLERGDGRIISIASQLGQIGAPELAHYSAAKAGVIAFTKALAREVSRRGVLVNCVAPGPIETPLLDGITEDWRTAKEGELPLGRFGRPEEVAPSVLLLASDPDGNLYTGQTLGPNSGDVML